MRQKLSLQIHIVLHEIRTSKGINILQEHKQGSMPSSTVPVPQQRINMTVHFDAKKFYITHGHLRPYVASLT